MIDFRIFRIPVRVQPFFFLIAVFLGYGLAGNASDWMEKLLLWIAIMFVGVLGHELGHAFAGRAFGLEARIELHGMGGLTWWEGGRQLSPMRSIIVSVAGPAVGILIGILGAMVWVASHSTGTLMSAMWAYLGGAAFELFDFFLLSVVWVNLGWGALNLIPMMPLDGGNVMASVIEMVATGRGRLFARYVSLAVAGALMLMFALVNGWLMVALLGWLAWNNGRGLRAEARLGQDLPLVPDLRQVQKLLEGGEPAMAVLKARDVLDRAKTPAVRTEALHLMAFGQLLAGAPEEARATLGALPEGATVDPAIEGAVLLETGRPDLAADRLEDALGPTSSAFVESRLVRALIETHRFDRAAQLVGSPRGQSLTVGAIQRLEEAAYRAHAFEDAARFGEACFERDGEPMAAYNTACSIARAGRPEEALTWLEKARSGGLEDAELLDTDDDLGSVRGLPQWSGFRAHFD